MSPEAARPVRVLQLGSPAGLFGAERWILALSKHLDPAQVRMTVGVVRDAGGDTPPLCVEAARLGFDTVVVDAPGRLSGAAVPALRALVRERRIDVLHTHFYKTDVLGAFAVRGARCALLSTPHGWSADAGLKLQAYEWIDRLALGFADAVSPLSEDLERGLARLPWVRPRLHAIRNGVDLSEVTASSRIAPELEALRARGAFVVGYVGQLITRKRLDTVLDAFAALDHPDKWLVLVGEGPQRAEFETRAGRLGIAPRVRFLGFRDDRLDWLRGFHAIVLASGLEGIPRCLMEAMAARVPMVSSDIEGSRALVSDGETGLLFPLGDAPALTRALARLAGDPSLAKRLVDAAETRVHRDFSAARMAAEYTALYGQLAVAARGGRAPVPEQAPLEGSR